ncbi:NAD-dependent epimerase/dehydratase family protein [Leptothrix ochracea]|uniref:NAD-dependent epimerase/dehydratase family protein n=1 Tax=Leptothrix ochracea TaxID=735331 RepID=UPI0034E1CCD1
MRTAIVPSSFSSLAGHTPACSKPRAFRQPRLLIVGCGDVGLRVAQALGGRLRLRALSSSPERFAQLRQHGLIPIKGNLDQPRSLTRLRGLAPWVMHLAPPPTQPSTPKHASQDPRTHHLLNALGASVERLIYASTTGVYGDAGGARFDETRPVAPATARAARRVDAERQLRQRGKHRGAPLQTALLRIPGIYALDREGGDPRERVRRSAPVLRPEDDVYTNHIHADDLARACIAALWRAKPQRVIHVCDQTELRMGDYFDLVADLSHLPRPPRLSRVDAAQQLGPMTLSFMSESRRLDATRLERELRLVLRYPDIKAGLARPVTAAPTARPDAPPHPAAATGSSPAALAPRS